MQTLLETLFEDEDASKSITPIKKLMDIVSKYIKDDNARKEAIETLADLDTTISLHLIDYKSLKQAWLEMKEKDRG